MSAGNRTFSEVWHQVADLRVNLPHTATLRKQKFRGDSCYIIQDPFNNNFFRITPEAYHFIARLRHDRTVAEAWEECLEKFPNEAPGQEDVVELLSQLHQANLLFCNLPADSRKLFERYDRRKQKETRSRVMNLMFFRIPLFDPGRLLKQYQGLVNILTGRIAVLIWILAILFAGKALIENFPQAVYEADTLLAYDNLLLLYLGLILVKVLHETGHTLVCSRQGGEVHAVGIMLIVFAPLPYMDATSSWAFRNRWQRILVASSGMLFEFFAAACATLIWANSAPGAIHSLAFNIMVVASVSTLLFNLNPLMRFDGYYIMSDLLEVPNLQQRAWNQLLYFVGRYGFGNRTANNPAGSRKEAIGLTFYGVSSGLYRIMVYVGIILFVTDQFLVAGLLMAMLCLYTWVVLPTIRFIRFLSSSPVLERNRTRAVGVTAATGLTLFLLMAIVPVPSRFSLPGVVEASHFAKVVNTAPGYVRELLATNGMRVTTGTTLLKMENPELAIEIRAVESQRDEIFTLQQESFTLHGDTARDMLKKRLDALNERLEKLLSDQEALSVRAKETGIWVAPRDYEMQGIWLSRGTELGQIIADDSFRFKAVLSQDEAANLFTEHEVNDVIVRLTGQGHIDLTISSHDIIPFEHRQLPSAVLGMNSGGDIPVTANDDQGVIAAEPFFLVFAEVENHEEAVLNQGHTGRMRFSLPPQPLFSQLLRKIQQYFQKRYQT